MSLDVYLSRNRSRDELPEMAKAVELLRQNGFEDAAFDLECRHDCRDYDELFSSNITHNLGEMAAAAGIYEHCWHPDRLGITKAGQLIEPLRAGLALLRSDPKRFEKYNSPNGWGLYEHFVPWLASYLSACEQYPDADVRACA